MSIELAFKEPVKLATTANITLSGEQTIDGVLTTEDRVLVKNQTNATENGIYVSSSGTWARATDFDGPTDFTTGTGVFVTEGSVNGDTFWFCTVSDDPPTIDTSTITWAAFNPAASTSGDLAAIEALTGTGIARRTGTDTWTVGDLVENAELADMAEATLKGRQAGAGTGSPDDLTGAEATAILDPFTADDNVNPGLKGLVPAPAAGDAAANKVLHADGTWDTILVTNGNLDDMPEATIKGRQAGAGSGDPDDLTGTEATAILNTFVGDNGVAVGTKGLVPATAVGDANKVLKGNATWGYPREPFIVAVTDEATVVTTGTNKVTFRMPYAFTLTDVRASLTTPQSANGSGGTLTIDIKENGTSIFTSPLLTINNTAYTSTSATQPTIGGAGPALADDSEITVSVTQIGNGTAAGLKVYLIGNQT